ncbi:hypothetical protein DFH08DRAFT_974593 [Mycena albidolilacea]|uniref:Uncharacterized protein n=1 Tax=Mycena albidolilacea TaxID=1033008 RepID=A0AAD6Z775_9AGAR|nr:hypothetical protein DFH08DRAFT_974593 [Mycena albidolilacea]
MPDVQYNLVGIAVLALELSSTTLYPWDKIWLKAAASALWVLTILESAQSLHAIIWNHAIIFFDNRQGAIGLNSTT